MKGHLRCLVDPLAGACDSPETPLPGPLLYCDASRDAGLELGRIKLVGRDRLAASEGIAGEALIAPPTARRAPAAVAARLPAPGADDP